MAATYTWQDAINVVAARNPRLIEGNTGVLIADQAASEIWNFADWRWSLAKVAPFFMVPAIQDYVTPYISIPTDFLGLRSADLVYNGTEPATRYPPLTIDRFLPITYVMTRPTAISFEATTSGFRLHPRPPSGIGPMDYQIECTYKKLPVKITAASLTGVLPFADTYFSVAVAAVRAFYTEKREDKEELKVRLADMASEETVNLGEQPLSPREPLVGY